MTVTDPLPAPSAPATDVELTRRARRLVETKRTDLAPAPLRVPLVYNRDPSCGDGVRNGQHDHMLVGRNEPGVQNIVRQLARATGYELAR